MRQTAADLLLIRPRHFGYNPDTAASNRFQSAVRGLQRHEIQARALAEHNALVAALRGAGVGMVVVSDTDTPAKPDAIFPNNWISFHEDGTVILYPMATPSRRGERRRDVIDAVEQQAGFRLRRLVDLTSLEQQGVYLEGTGSLVIDHAAGVAYAALSDRTHSPAVERFARETGIEVVAFNTRDACGTPLYHTNVMLSIGTAFVVVCPAVIPDAGERRSVIERLAASGREIIAIEPAQLDAFAANLLEVTAGGHSVVAMSEAARQAFEPAQLGLIASHAEIIATPIPTIERVGGGSVRCMLAEIFLSARP
jgi:hypothetical protein